LDSFLEDIIDYARNAKATAVVSSVNIIRLVDEVIENFRFIPGADKIRFEKSIHLDHEIVIDRVRLYIILNNIIANAVNYQRPQARDKWIKISTDLKDDRLEIIISDNGQGIEEEMISKVFQMFFRGTNQSKGSGLGLCIVKEAVERMGGDIKSQSELGKGTSFALTFPVTVGEKIKKRPKHDHLEEKERVSIL
jgi:signal transduction histidine kinase